MKLVAEDVTLAVIKDCGHWVTAERLKGFSASLSDFSSKRPDAK